MKRLKLWAVAAALIMTASCEKPVITEDETVGNTTATDSTTTATTKKFTFTLKGDFSTDWKPVTRGYLQADGKDLTDVWVLDYMDGKLVQQVHQTDNTAEDFGKPVMNLKYGSHHIYFIASRGQGAELDTDTKTITFTKVLDTFYKDYEVSVASSSNGNRAVTLDRVVTRLRLTFTDAVSAETSTITIAPDTWYYGLDYLSGDPCEPKTAQPTTLTIPSTDKGKTGVQLNLFGFSQADEWKTDVSITAKDADNQTVSSVRLMDVPLKANRITEYAGPLFGSEGAMSLSLNSTWDDAYTGVW
jgi:hypothetical protein